MDVCDDATNGLTLGNDMDGILHSEDEDVVGVMDEETSLHIDGIGGVIHTPP